MAFAAPRLFESMLEYPIAIVVVITTLLVFRWRPFLGFLRRESPILLVGSLAFCAFLGVRAFPYIKPLFQSDPVEIVSIGER